MELLHENVKKYGTVFNTIAPGTVLSGVLYTFALPKLAKIRLSANVHFTPEGYKALADQLAAAIVKVLAKPK